MFQFHYGSIKIADNPIRVVGDLVFQFHYGSIKIVNAPFDDNGTLISFNSTMVRLKSVYKTLITNQLLQVSIPLWFD